MLGGLCAGGLCPGGLCLGVSVQEHLCLRGVCPGGFCLGGGLLRASMTAGGAHPTGMHSCFKEYIINMVPHIIINLK